MLILAATPIGNLADASPRLRQTLAMATVIAAEDTRKTKQLLQLLEITTAAKLIAVHDHNEKDKAEQLAQLAATSDVVLVSDAGMPTVSDPGYRVVAAAVLAEVPITVIPGPSAPVTALALSGMATDRFAFEGFLPRKTNDLTRTLSALKDDPRTLIFFEAPQRITVTLEQLAKIFGPERPVAICRELTKRYEEVLRGTAAELARELQQRQLKGEIVLVVAGATPQVMTAELAYQQVAERVAAGERLKDACRAVAASTGASARELYDLALANKGGK
ncbi:16S rRNA (cytidine(1402)-2'-O)-methyltransferase [Leucobacter sp. OH2974_COT-288]|uniref:16S rRNA (cytidine(1402)-2'-O)-methyltransferase n=1 Tax=Canibacter oris TaxID=1365628 RepID=UPI000F602943|nr:16S rRNA (cytidine(1402)-2'-O)-methyltransferase [Canibacter oris]RRD36626.1 16S rRNA (cytidine(1402)-2'-O)-methyltransferase [Leucobacter sp. OH2974_COT-288]